MFFLLWPNYFTCAKVTFLKTFFGHASHTSSAWPRALAIMLPHILQSPTKLTKPCSDTSQHLDNSLFRIFSGCLPLSFIYSNFSDTSESSSRLYINCCIYHAAFKKKYYVTNNNPCIFLQFSVHDNCICKKSLDIDKFTKRTACPNREMTICII